MAHLIRKLYETQNVVNFLKLRAAYTMAGNDNLPLFAGRTYYTSENFSRYATGLVLGNTVTNI